LGDLTHEILQKKAENKRKIVGRERERERESRGMSVVTIFLKGDNMCNSLVQKITDKQICFEYGNFWAVFSKKDDK